MAAELSFRSCWHSESLRKALFGGRPSSGRLPSSIKRQPTSRSMSMLLYCNCLAILLVPAVSTICSAFSVGHRRGACDTVWLELQCKKPRTTHGQRGVCWHCTAVNVTYIVMAVWHQRVRVEQVRHTPTCSPYSIMPLALAAGGCGS